MALSTKPVGRRAILAAAKDMAAAVQEAVAVGNEAAGLANTCLNRTELHETRIDGAVASIRLTDAAVGKVDGRVDGISRRTYALEELVTRGTFVERLRWIFSGRLPEVL